MPESRRRSSLSAHHSRVLIRLESSLRFRARVLGEGQQNFGEGKKSFLVLIPLSAIHNLGCFCCVSSSSNGPRTPSTRLPGLLAFPPRSPPTETDSPALQMPVMSDSSPNLISYEHNNEKYSFRGILIAAILHGMSHKPDRFPTCTHLVCSVYRPGIVVVLFCQCMGALLSPTNHKHKAGGIRWGLVTLTTAMFLFSTTALALNLDALSSNYIDTRNNPILPLPGPLGSWIDPSTFSIILTNMISLNQWLADGLLVSSVFMSAVQAS